jgi:hypothetical protein
LSLPTIVFLAPAVVCVLSWLGAGAVVPRRAATGDALLDLLTQIGIGSALVSVLLFTGGRAGLFHEWLVAAVTVALALLGVARIGAVRRLVRAPRPRERVTRALLALTGVAIALDLIAAAAPPTSADALKYHLALPKWWLERGAIDDTFWRWEGFSPFGIEMLYAQGLSLGGGEVASIVNGVFALLAAAAVYVLARDLGGGEALAGAAGAALFVLQGIVTWEATSSFVELGLVFYATLAAAHALRHVRTRATEGALLAGALAGAAAGTRYLGLVAGGLALLPVAFAAVRSRAWTALAATSALALLVASPWYLRNLLSTGNPVYPVFFGGDEWTDASQRDLDSTADRYGLHAALPRLAILPLDLLVHGDRFDRGQYVGTAIFLFAALALLVRPSRLRLAVTGAAAAYGCVWWVLSPQARFLLPALAALAAVGGAGAAAWLRTPGIRRVAAGLVLAAAVVAWAASSGALTRQLLPPVVGAESRDHHLQRLTGTSDAYRAIARDTDGTVAVGGYLFPYTYPGRALGLDAPEFASDVPPETYVRRLRAHRVRWIVVPELAGRAPALDPIRACLRRVRGYDARLVLSRTRGGSIPWPLGLYELRSPPATPQCPA